MNIVIIVTGSIVGVAYLTELFISWYSGVEYESYAFINRFSGPYSLAYWTMMTCNVISPQLFWIKKIRRSLIATFILSIVVNIGMWFERYVIVVTSLHNEYEPFAWGIYRPSVIEMSIMVGSFFWFGFWFLLFTRLLPPIAIQELKEVLPPPMRKKRSPEVAEAHQ